MPISDLNNRHLKSKLPVHPHLHGHHHYDLVISNQTLTHSSTSYHMLHRSRLHSSRHNPLVSPILLNGFNTIPSYTTGHHALNNSFPLFKTILQWNTIIKSHLNAGFSQTALSLFSAMRRHAYLHPDRYTLPLINRAVSSLPGLIGLGRAVHCLGMKLGLDSDVYFCNTAIEMYLRCACFSSARSVFDEMRHEKDVVSWTSMISGYVRVGDACEPFRLFSEMRMAGLEPSSVTLAVVLRACSAEGDEERGRQLHGFVIKRGFERHELVKNSILTAYSTVGCFEEAADLFCEAEKRSVVSWNIMMAMYLSIGEVRKVVGCFESMMNESLPSHETLTLVVSAFAKSKALHRGRKVHSYTVKSGLVDSVMQSTLIDFYAKCGELASSVQLFEEVEDKNSITWTVLMWGFIHNGQYKEAISLFRKMLVADCEPTPDTLRVLILACTHLGALQFGKGVHAYLIRNNFHDNLDNTTLKTSILNMYVKCGSIDLAQRCFAGMVVKDTIAWSSMIEGYGIHGLGLKAFRLFCQMQEERIKPNSITFLSLLSACSHSGLVSEGCEVFDCMTRRFGIKPGLNHYTCMVDLLGRSGKLREALELIHDMTTEPDGRIWGALLASCRTYSDVKIGAFAAQRLFELEPDNVGYHVVLSNIHARDSKWDEAESIRKFMGEKDLKKMPGWSCIEVEGGVHMFVAGDRSHPQVQEFYEVLRCLTTKMEEMRCS